MLDDRLLADLVQFPQFPRGACGDTCLLLARWLEQNGFGHWDIVSGWRNGWSHAWLQRDGLIIDVTADQFPDGQSPVVITDDATWHNLFNGKVVDWEAFGPDDPLTAAYERLEAKLKRDQ